MSIVAVAVGTTVVGAGAAIGGAMISSSASKSAANTQAEAAYEAAKLQAEASKYQTDVQKDIYEQQKAVMAPYVAAGETGQNRLLEYLGIGGSADAQDYGKYATAEFTPDQFLAGQDPAYAFRMSEGLSALEKTAAARGGLLSGNAMQAAQTYGQGLASEEYQNAFNRYQTTRTNTLSPYQSLQGVGEAAAAGQAANLSSLGSNLANISQTSAAAQAGYNTSAANALAAGTVGSANAWSSALNSIGGAATSYGLMQGMNTSNAQSAVNASYNANLGTLW
jgi:hypothetical protein